MANPNVVINSVQYSTIPQVEIPKVGGGTAVFYYTGDATAAAGDILTGKSAFGASGAISGSIANNGATGGTIGTVAGTYAIPAGYTSGGTVSLTNISDCQAGNILAGKSILGVNGTLTTPTVSQNSTTKVLTIS